MTLLLAGVLVFLGLLVFQTAVIGDLTYRRLCRRRDFDQVQSCGPSARERVFGRQDAELFAVFVDDANGTNADLIVDAEGSCYVRYSCVSNKKWRCRSSPTAETTPPSFL